MRRSSTPVGGGSGRIGSAVAAGWMVSSGLPGVLGLVVAVANLDEVVAMIRGSSNPAQARAKLHGIVLTLYASETQTRQLLSQ